MKVERFDTPGPVALRVRNKSGSVEVIAHDQPTTEVEVSAFDDEAEDAVTHTRIEQEGSGGRNQIVIEVPDSSGGGRSGGFLRRVISLVGDGPAVQVTVRCPARSSIDVETSSGAISGRGILGSADLQTASGEARLDRLEGDLKVRTASGDIAVLSVAGTTRIETASGDVNCGALAGHGSVTTASGDVAVDSAAAMLDVRTASGDVRANDVQAGCEIRSASGDHVIERLVSGRVRLDSVSGDLVIGIARGSSLQIDAQSVSGELSSEIDLEGDAPSGGQDGPALDLRVRTVSGDVRVVRAP